MTANSKVMAERRLASAQRRSNWHAARKWRQAYEARTHGLAFRIDFFTWREMRARATRNGTTIAEMCRTFIEWGLENSR
jgi:hypothetical protein